MSYVYFLRPVGAEGPVKIGCSVAPYDRLTSYQKFAPVPLEMVALIKGGLDLERRFHAAFADHHSHHEWFLEAPAITAAIQAVNAGAFDPDALPPGRTVIKRAYCTPEGLAASRVTRAINRAEARGISVPANVKAATFTYRDSPAEMARKRALARQWAVENQIVAA